MGLISLTNMVGYHILTLLDIDLNFFVKDRCFACIICCLKHFGSESGTGLAK
jgi:hypothetical protein